MVLFTIIVLLSSYLGTYFASDAEALDKPQMTDQRNSDSFFSASFGGVVISPFDYAYSLDTAKDVFKLAVQTFSDISNLEEEYEFWKKDDEEPDRGDILDNSGYESVHASSKGFKSTVKVPQKTRVKRKFPKQKSRSPPSKFERFMRWFIYRFMTGLGVVGILSFLNLLFSVGLIAPLRLFGGNWTRGQRRAAANDTATLLVLVVIIIGVARYAYNHVL
jgi:hypothetical protein